MVKLLEGNAGVMSWNLSKLRFTDILEHIIDTGKNPTVNK